MTPRLRFPEFTDEWHVKKLGTLISKMQSGLSRKLSRDDIGLPVIRSNNIKNQNLHISDIAFWYKHDPQGADTAKYVLREGDLLINFINSQSQIGKFTIYKDQLRRDAIFTTNIMRIRFNEKTTSQFIAYVFASKKYTNFIQSITKPAVNQASFTTLDLKKFNITIPSRGEQQKIADFLTTVDDKITALDKKVELLKQYKKGVMQQIFSQQVRFKDENGQDYPEWEMKRFGDSLKSVSSGKSKTITDGHEYPIYGSTGRIGASGSFDYSGDKLLVARVGANAGSMYRVNGRYKVSDNTLMVNLSDDIDTSFIQCSLTQFNLNRLVFGSGQPLVTGGLLKKIIIQLPSKPEQQKIASFLTTLDDKITAEQTRLDAAKEWKKGLLQRMFV